VAEFLALTLPPILIALCAGLSCAATGTFLMLNRQAMLGDALAHVVLPGIVAAFLLTGSGAPPVMIAGALAAAAVSVGLIALVRRAGVEGGAAMAIVFTTMFAGGVVLLEQSGASAVHLDVEHALYGNLESLIWLDGTSLSALADPAALAGLPPDLFWMAPLAAAVVGLVTLLHRPLAAVAFDAGQARMMGLPVRALSAVVVTLATIAAVAAFSAVGAILVIAMLVCPPAAAWCLAPTAGRQLVLALAFAALAAVAGPILAGYGPPLLGAPFAVSAAGMIAVVAGLLLAIAVRLPRRRQATES
jgi:manganese/zinc/iron transport system permease protein